MITKELALTKGKHTVPQTTVFSAESVAGLKSIRQTAMRMLSIICIALLMTSTLPLTAFAATTQPVVAAGGWHSLAINAEGQLWAWGRNVDGQLGIGASGEDSMSDVPVRVGTASDWVDVSAGDNHTLAINSSGQLYAWGFGGNGQLGRGDKSSSSVPVRVGNASNWKIVNANGQNSFAINTNGQLFAWGMNNDGSLGLGTSGKSVNSPTQVGTATNWKTVSTSPDSQAVHLGDHTLAITTTGELWAWGSAFAGQLGDGRNRLFGTNTKALISNVPIRIDAETSWTDISAGSWYSAGISDGQSYEWGLGGAIGFADTPMRLGLASDWKSISAGGFGGHVHAINNAGQLFAWGGNDSGQLGLGITSEEYVTAPTRLGKDSNWASVSSGHNHTLALNTAGKVLAWGENYWGQLGDGTTAQRTSPVAILDVGAFTPPAPDPTPTPDPTPVPKPAPAPVAPATHTVSFNAQGGTAVATRKVTNGKAVGVLPATTRPGFTFAGWHTHPTAGTPVHAGTVVTASTTYHARWVAQSNNANLKGLKASKGKLTQKFSAGRSTHTLRLTKAQSQVRLTPVRAHGKSRLQVLVGKTWRNVSSHNVKVGRGKTATVRFRVIAENGAVKNHTVRVQRAK